MDEGVARYNVPIPICLLQIPPSARCQLLLNRTRPVALPGDNTTEAYAYNGDLEMLGSQYEYGEAIQPAAPHINSSLLNKSI